MMSEKNKQSNSGRELTGIALFGVFSFPLVLAVLALLRPSGGDATGTAALAAQLVSAFGAWPTILLSAGFAGVGAALLLAGKNTEVDVGRNLSGFLFSAIGLGVCLGAVSPTYGGVFGANTGGALAASLATWVGFAVGAAVLFTSAWLTWLGGAPGFLGKRGKTTTISDALSEKDTDGVSAAEASALVPDAATVAYMEQVWCRDGKPVEQSEPIPPSQYPEDVRLQGAVPEGAQPLALDDEPTIPKRPDQADPSPGELAHSPDGTKLGVGEDLATPEVGKKDHANHAGDTGEQSSPGRWSRGSDPAGGQPLDEAETAETAETAEADEADEAAAEELGAGGPTASWEQPNLFDATEAEKAEEEVPVGEEEAPEASEEAEEDLQEEEEGEYEEEELEDEEYEEEDEGEEEEDEEEEEDGEEEWDEAAELEEEEEEEEELEEDEEEEDEDEEGELEEEEEEELEHAEAEEEEEEGEDEEEEEEEDQSEPERVIAPTPPPARPARDLDPADLLQQAGDLFLEQRRVAVSLLQRRFALDFDEACALLDDLQQEGLIGPYKGGQKRDILLTPEQWGARASSR